MITYIINFVLSIIAGKVPYVGEAALEKLREMAIPDHLKEEMSKIESLQKNLIYRVIGFIVYMILFIPLALYGLLFTDINGLLFIVGQVFLLIVQVRFIKFTLLDVSKREYQLIKRLKDE